MKECSNNACDGYVYGRDDTNCALLFKHEMERCPNYESKLDVGCVAPGEIYKHCKGKKYKIICVARNSDKCNEKIVVYQSLEKSDFPKGTIWTRSLSEFIDKHSSGVKRFVKLGISND